MSHKDRKHIGSFTAATADGVHESRLHHYQEYHISGTRRVEGHKLILNEEGELVNWLSKGKYHDVTLGLDLFCDDPSAP
jgi:hypothetical protein